MVEEKLNVNAENNCYFAGRIDIDKLIYFFFFVFGVEQIAIPSSTFPCRWKKVQADSLLESTKSVFQAANGAASGYASI